MEWLKRLNPYEPDLVTVWDRLAWRIGPEFYDWYIHKTWCPYGV